ncbi:MAG: sodium:calcium antiporter [Proteobacteria bacterium]|nr:sodium:calcium antiporter [Pseudomonadota bacterium]
MSFKELPIWANGSLFLAAAVAIWFAGGWLARLMDRISARTGLGQAFVGTLFLGATTSLPEMTAVSTSASLGDAGLALSTLLGSLAFNVLTLVIADAAIGSRSLMGRIAGRPTVVQGLLNIVALALAVCAIVAGDLLVFGVGVWTIALALFAALVFWIVKSLSGREPSGETAPAKDGDASLGAIAIRAVSAAAIILAGGVVLARAGGGLADQTGLGGGFGGFLLVGVASSMPELATVLAAARLGNVVMAAGDVFGTNIFNLALLLVADAFYAGGPILDRAGRFEAVAALIALAMTAILLIGIVGGQRRTWLRLGASAWATAAVYVAGMAILYAVQGRSGAISPARTSR